MSTSAVSSLSLYKELQAYFGVRHHDLQKLGNALQSGDLAGAQQEFANIQNLGKHGPLANGNPFISSQRESDFEAIGSALQSGDLAGASQAFSQLQSTFVRPTQPPVPEPAAGSSSNASAGSTSSAAVHGSGVSVIA